ncbi:MAG: PIN domain-containing protein [Verrucomicrobiae bacterium]|nr:PIN domain-containing protein [Verrucomicrobiae bacterium]
MPNHIYRVVLDTNQIVAAGTGWLEHGRPSFDNNTCRRVLIHVAESHTGLYCGKIIGEYLEKLIDLNHPPERAQKLITYLIGAFERVVIVTSAAPAKPSDPDDEVFLLCALDGQAHYLVSDDGALLNLKQSYTRPVIGGSTELAPLLSA